MKSKIKSKIELTYQKKLTILLKIIICSTPLNSISQVVKENIEFNRYTIPSNQIENYNNNFCLFIKKINELKKDTSNKKINIVHIGDSHVQGEVFTNTIRSFFHETYGKAGSGILFPYNLAKTNGSNRHILTSKNTWTSQKITTKIGQLNAGILGYVIQTNDTIISLKYSTTEKYFLFNKIFIYANTNNNSIKFYSDSINYTTHKIVDNYCGIKTNNLVDNFKIEINSPKDSITNFYGYSIENENSKGIIYNSIGVNGAKYSDFIKSKKFWNQLKNIYADCIIISLGTNEAQNNNLDFFNNELFMMVEELKKIYPNAAIIITTPPISYYKKISINKNLNIIGEIIKKYCLENGVSYWDLYCIQEDIDGIIHWKKNKFLRPDLIHYSNEGYILHAKLFINALNKFLSVESEKLN